MNVTIFKPFVCGKECYDKNTLGVSCPGASPRFGLNKEQWCYRCSCYKVPKPTERPPLGLMPSKLHRELRMLDILAAMTRYTVTSQQLPEEWLRELETINKRIY